MDKVIQDVISIVMGCEEASIASAFWFAGDRLCDAPVEAFDHAVGLRLEGSCQAVRDAMVSADLVEGVVSGWRSSGRGPSGTAEAVGKLGAERERLSLTVNVRSVKRV